MIYFALGMRLLQAGDYGIRGQVFLIQEQDLLEYLKNKLSSLSEIERFESKIQQPYLKIAKEPKGVQIEEAREYRVYYFDPSITTSKDIHDHQNRLIVSKGARVNPLSMCSLAQDLLFIDGSKESHIKWAKEHGPLARWILVKGKPLDLEEQESHPIYFDQFGFLTSKLEIQKIPAKVTQENNQLKIEEIPL